MIELREPTTHDGRRGGVPDASSGEPRCARTLSVLIVEDDADTRELLEDGFRAAGLDVHAASDGERALALLASGARIDVVLVDLMMPGINGWDLVPLLRKNPQWAGAPVVVMSAAGTKALAGAPVARAYFEKPFDLDELVATVRRVAS